MARLLQHIPSSLGGCSSCRRRFIGNYGCGFTAQAIYFVFLGTIHVFSGIPKGAFPNLPLDMSKFFEQLCVPLNSLCDRCEDRPYPTSQALVDLLQKILGPSRIKDHGIDFSWPSSNDESNKGTSDANGCAEGYHMSLDEIEKLLESPNAVMVASSVANSIEQPPSHVTTSAPTNTQTFPATRPSWVRCQAWDPCSIGSLPGYPV